MADVAVHEAIGLEIEGPTDGVTRLRLSGDWTLATQTALHGLRGTEEKVFAAEGLKRIEIDASDLNLWDSFFVSFMLFMQRRCEEQGIEFKDIGTPAGLERLVAIANAGRRAMPKQQVVRSSLLTDVGKETVKMFGALGDMLEFFGEACKSLARLVVGKARMRASDLFLIIEQCGPQALPIVTLICFLIGVIMAFVGAIQLQRFGAEIFVANLVGVGMVRELGPVMAAIVMAGRTGAAFAAQLGTMTVNEEVSALETTGIPPMDFLVLPRMVALIIMMPLLVIYANVVGMLGGMLIADVMLNISPLEYYIQTTKAVGMIDWAGGLFKASVFGVLVAVAGCMRGIQTGRSASAVGTSTTSAVVTGIVMIIAVDATLTVFYTVIGI